MKYSKEIAVDIKGGQSNMFACSDKIRRGMFTVTLLHFISWYASVTIGGYCVGYKMDQNVSMTKKWFDV